MQYLSTISRYNSLSLRDAITRTVAQDSGVLMPASLPVIPRAVISTLPAMHLVDMAYCVAASLFGQDMELETIRRIALNTYSHPMPVVKLGKQLYSLELWHGPTGTVKDYGVEFMAGMLEHLVIRQGGKVKVIATATSNAARALARSYARRRGFTAILLVPRIGSVGQMIPDEAYKADNIHIIDIRGTEHQCRKLMMEAMNDKDFQTNGNLTVASTLNIAALLPQIIHFFYGYSRAVAQGASPDEVVFAVPCGNMAGLTAAVMAKRMGLPIKRIVAAGNANLHLSEYFESGSYPETKVVRTDAHAMDIAHPLNMPRLEYLYNGSPEKMKLDIESRRYTDKQINDTVITAQCSMNYNVDVHTACALRGIVETLQPGEAGVFLSTARPPEPDSARSMRRLAPQPIAPTYTSLKHILNK